MQLTKDDVIKAGKLQEEWEKGQHNYDERLLDFAKFQQVVEFYEKYRAHGFIPDTGGDYFLEKDYPEIHREYAKHLKDNHKNLSGFVPDIYNDWLFNYCFKDGLK